MNIILLVALLVSLAVYAAMIGVYRWLGWTREVEARLTRTMAPVAAETGGRKALSARMNQRLRRLSFAESVERRLIAANSNMTVAEYLMTRFGFALAGLIAGWLFSGYAIGGILLAMIGSMLPSFYLKRQQSKRAKDFAEQLPDLLGMLVGSLRAGYGLLHAITVVEQEMPQPISTEFGRVVRETALGYSIGDALDHLVERIDNEDLALIVTAIHIQNEVGGSLAEVLDTISNTIRERIKLHGEIRALTAQQRASAGILSALPFVVGTLIMLVNPDYMMGVFQPGWPILIPIAAVILVVMGNVAMRMFVKIEV